MTEHSVAPLSSRGPLLEWVRSDESLSNEQCDSIIALSRSYEPSRGRVGNTTIDDYRQAIVHRLTLDSRSTQFHGDTWSLVQRINHTYFGFDLSSIVPPDFIEYKPGFGRFGWHSDITYHARDVVRKLTVVIQLSEGNEYQGGDLQVFCSKPISMPRERGAIVAFPAFLQHCVTPVTSGERRSLVVFGIGPSFR